MLHVIVTIYCDKNDKAQGEKKAACEKRQKTLKSEKARWNGKNGTKRLCSTVVMVTAKHGGTGEHKIIVCTPSRSSCHRFNSIHRVSYIYIYA